MKKKPFTSETFAVSFLVEECGNSHIYFGLFILGLMETM